MKPSICKLSLLAALVVPAVAACSTSQPVTQGIDDSGTTSRVKAQLAADPNVRMFKIDPDTVDGVVYLHGEVPDEKMKKEAEEIASNTRGVRRVVNQLQVKKEGETRDVGGPDWDSWITAKVKSRLSVDPEVRAMNIDVDTQDGVVYLTGVVAEEIDRDEAVKLAREVDGVDKVVNNLKLEEEMRDQQQRQGAAMEAQGPSASEKAQKKQDKQIQQDVQQDQEAEQQLKQEEQQKKDQQNL